MVITILTLFPEMFTGIFPLSIIGRAQKKGLVKINYVNIRDFATDRHKSVDDKPYGGGIGMIMRVDVVERAIQNSKLSQSFWGTSATPESDSGQARTTMKKYNEKVILLDPKGKQFDQKTARRFSKLDHLILVCGHYEGIDNRIDYFVDEKISIGEYILTGGEIPAMVVTDATVRLIKNVLVKAEAVIDESFTKENLLESPQFTRPYNFKGVRVPSILLSGNHKKIKAWREKSQKSFK